MDLKFENNELENYLKELLKKDFEKYINASPEPTGIRINPLKTSLSSIQKKLKNWEQSYEKINFNEFGMILHNDKLPLSHTLDYFCGNIYYQGVSSQLPVELLGVKPGEKILDMTAAPGSKSCQILANLTGKGELIVNDSSYKRMQPLNVNLQRTGATNFYILNTWGERLGQIYPEYFDKVLLDAPCTTLGNLAQSDEIANWWRVDKLKKLANSQSALLVSAIKALKVGGELVYSTCSIAPEENELVLQKVLKKYPVEILEIPGRLKKLFEPGLTKYKDKKLDSNLHKAIRIYPHLHGLEGFYAIKLRKFGSTKVKPENKHREFVPLLSWNHHLIQPILDHLSDYWGIDNSFWQKFNYNLFKNRIWIVSDINDVPAHKLTCSGTLLAEKKLSCWKLFNNSATFLRDLITKRNITVDDEELIKLFKNGMISFKGLKNGYYVLSRNNQTIASVYMENEKMKIKLPHTFNLILDN